MHIENAIVLVYFAIFQTANGAIVIEKDPSANLVASPSQDGKKKTDAAKPKADPPNLPENLSLKAVSDIDKIKNVSR